MQDALWSIVTLEFVQILLDLFHILLLVPILCLPWRLTALAVCLFEPKERWHTRLGIKAVREFRTAGWLLGRFKVSFVPHCNELLKDRSVAQKWHDSGKPPLLRLQDLVAHGAVSRGLRSAVEQLPTEIGQMLEYNLDLQDAHLYYVALRAYTHCALSRAALTVEEHATILEEIAATESSLAAVQLRSASALEHAVNEAHQAAIDQGCRKCGFWRKDITLLRSMVRALAAAALSDMAGFGLCLLLVLTVYRLPLAIADLIKERTWNPTRNRFRIIVLSHLRKFAEEVLLALQVFLLTVLLVATCIRLPEAVHSMGRSTCLRELRNNLWQDFVDALKSLWELLSLFALWRTYSLIFRAIAQSVLVPPACLSELMGVFCSCLPLAVRFALGILFTVALVTAPFLGPSGQTAFFYGMVVLLLAACAATAKRQGEADIQGWSCSVLRLSWSNATAIAAVFVEPALLCLALSTLLGAKFHSVDPEHTAPLLGLATRGQLCDMVSPFAVAGCSLTVVWLLLLSLMFVTGQQAEHKALQENSLLRFLQLLVSHTLSVPICLSLLLPTACTNTQFQMIGLALFALYACTTQALSTESGLLEPPSDASGLDLRYPSRYININQAVNIGICIACVCPSSGDVIVIVGLACTQLIYDVLYRCMSRGPMCSTPYVAILRIGGATAVLATASFIWYQRTMADLQLSLLLYLLIALLCLTISGALLSAACARRSRKRELKESGILDECRALLRQTQEALCDAEAVLGLGTQSVQQHLQTEMLAVEDAGKLALLLLAFEGHILVEWLTFDFLENRADWRRALLRARDFEGVRSLILQLRNGFQSPPTQQRLTSCISSVLGRADLAELVVDYVVGYRELRALLQPALFCAKSAKKPGKQCVICPKGGRVRMGAHLAWAHDALRLVLSRFNQTINNSTKPAVAGLMETQIGYSKMNVLSEPSDPKMYWPHLASMLQSAGRLLDRHGELHGALPCGLVVNRVLPRGSSEKKLSRKLSRIQGQREAYGETSSTTVQATLLGEQVGKASQSAELTSQWAVLPLETSLDVHPTKAARVTQMSVGGFADELDKPLTIGA
jgi:hypothetical protein